ncbi:MAG: NAD(+) kinase [bacterium]|nr:NAD(+) kinase [bacterium]
MNQPAKIECAVIVYNPAKEGALGAARKASEALRAHGVRSRTVEYSQTNHIHDADLADVTRECGAVIVLGGDGTILGVARQIASQPKPLLGINLGGFGFLTSSAQHELEIAIEALATGDYRVVNRFFLQARVERDDGEPFQSYALNESLITLAQPGRLLELSVGEDDRSALTYRADGLIISTPTGSTGHSLSAGGPILEPNLPALIVTPVSPHSLFNRPLVVNGERELIVRFLRGGDRLLLILDGQIRTELCSTDVVRVRRSEKSIATITLPDRSFSQVLRLKFNLGERPGKT